MKNLKLTNLEKMQENEMQQIKGGIFGMGKTYVKISSSGRICIGACPTVANETTGRRDHGNQDRDDKLN